MPVNAYHVNQLVRLTATLTVSGVATDPATLTIRVKDPTGAEVVYTLVSNPALVKDSVGNYHIDITVGIAGLWSYHLESTGAVQASDDEQFVVLAAVA